MLKPALFAITGAGVAASAYFSGACPPLLAAAQLVAYAVVYGLKPVPSAPARTDQFFGYVSVGAFLYVSKFFEYWTMGLAGPLAQQAIFLPVPLVLSFGARAFPDAWNEAYHSLNRWEIALQAIFLALIPIFAVARDDPAPLGIPTALIAWIAVGIYSISICILASKDTEKSVADVRAYVYASAAAIALVSGFYSASGPRNRLAFALFVASCLAHAAVRKWHDAGEGSKFDEGSKISGEWSTLRAALVVAWAWLTERPSIVGLYLAALSARAYFLRKRRERPVEIVSAAGDSALPFD